MCVCGVSSMQHLTDVWAHSLAKTLLQHPHIVRFYDQFVDVNCVNIVTEYCDGGDLSDAIESQKDPANGNGAPFGEAVVLNWLVQLTTVQTPPFGTHAPVAWRSLRIVIASSCERGRVAARA